MKREYPYHRWEPIYIGTKHDPYYSETLSWEGQQDKMTQVGVTFGEINFLLTSLHGSIFSISLFSTTFVTALFCCPCSQMLEMCLMGYRFVILDGAFLVHWPGIKRNKKQNRSPHWDKNARQYNAIANRLFYRYPQSVKCTMQ